MCWEHTMHGLSESLEMNKLRRRVQDSSTSGLWQGIIGKELAKPRHKREQVIALDVVHPLKSTFRISVVDSSTAEKGVPAE